MFGWGIRGRGFGLFDLQHISAAISLQAEEVSINNGTYTLCMSRPR